MRKYLLRNRHTLLLGVTAAFSALMLLEAGLSGRKLFEIEIDNSFLHLRVGDEAFLEELEFLEDFGIDIDF
ncbi:MAG: hypothetical protein OXI13_04265 [Gammaproteobacteria bacterium]|nr:hypothetical protein [Gammaproteobacteria bacterium]